MYSESTGRSILILSVAVLLPVRNPVACTLIRLKTGNVFTGELQCPFRIFMIESIVARKFHFSTRNWNFGSTEVVTFQEIRFLLLACLDAIVTDRERSTIHHGRKKTQFTACGCFPTTGCIQGISGRCQQGGVTCTGYADLVAGSEFTQIVVIGRCSIPQPTCR